LDRLCNDTEQHGSNSSASILDANRKGQLRKAQLYRWRAKNLRRYNAYQRGSMRKRRADARANSA
jgi:hypothetical protein